MRIDNIEMLYDTLGVFQQGCYEFQEEMINVKLSQEEQRRIHVFLPDEVEKICRAKETKYYHNDVKMQVQCANMDSFSLARKVGAEKILVLNLANPVHPGGGVRRGAKAQEEDLCRKSSLLLSLESHAAKKYYEYNKSLHTYMGSDAMMITHKVEIIKDEMGDFLPESVIVSVLTCAAPMLRQGKQELREKDYLELMYHRICAMLKVAAYDGYETLVLGAFGCGAFGNDARIVSDMFCRALKEFDYAGKKAENYFYGIHFAVLSPFTDSYNFIEFSRNFSDYYGDKKAAQTNAAQKYVFFWKDSEKNGFLSNWYPRKFVVDDFEYLHMEQYMMAQKAKLFHDARHYTEILRATEPKECKDIGRKVQPFDEKRWNAAKYDLIKIGLRAKFEQNPDLKKGLLATGSRILAEASPYDGIWGIRLDAETAGNMEPSQWPGQNLLGKALMDVRGEIG